MGARRRPGSRWSRWSTAATSPTEDQRVYYALIKYWDQRGRSDTFTPFSLRHLADLLAKKWGTRTIDGLTESLMRLRTTAFLWSNSYFDAATGETVEVLDPFNVLSDLKIARRQRDGHATGETGYFRFHDAIAKNLLANHTKPLLFDVVLSFRARSPRSSTPTST